MPLLCTIFLQFLKRIVKTYLFVSNTNEKFCSFVLEKTYSTLKSYKIIYSDEVLKQFISHVFTLKFISTINPAHLDEYLNYFVCMDTSSVLICQITFENSEKQQEFNEFVRRAI